MSPPFGWQGRSSVMLQALQALLQKEPQKRPAVEGLQQWLNRTFAEAMKRDAARGTDRRHDAAPPEPKQPVILQVNPPQIGMVVYRCIYPSTNGKQN